MKKLMLLILGVLFSAHLFASESQCQLTPLGGPDVFPWGSIAKPFPWDKIKGLWKINNDSDTVLKIKVTRENARNKHLYVEVYFREKCEEPVMRGVGLISASEKNVARINLADKEGNRKLMKLAMFDTEDLKMSSFVCGDEVLAASLVALADGEGPSSKSLLDQERDFVTNEKESDAPTMVLKKVTGSLDYFCKKSTPAKY